MASKGSRTGGVVWTSHTRMGVAIAKFDAKLDARLAVLVDRQGDVGTRKLKQDAPWTDRTGNARATLAAEVKHTKRVHTIHLHGGMPYQIYLETMQSGRFAVIRPTMLWLGKKTMAMARTLIAQAASS